MDNIRVKTAEDGSGYVMRLSFVGAEPNGNAYMCGKAIRLQKSLEELGLVQW